LHIAIHISVSLKDLFTSNEFYPFRWINQSPNLVSVHKIHLRFHEFKPFVRINIRYCFHIIGKLIRYEQFTIINFHEKLISQLCIMCSTKSIEFLCFLSFKFSIKCYSLEHLFHLDVYLWFFNFIKFYLSLTTRFKNKFLLYKDNIFLDKHLLFNEMVEIIFDRFFWISYKLIII